MSDQEDLVAQFRVFIDNHLKTYLSSSGAEGHIMDMSHVGVAHLLPTLLLKTVGRRSGKPLIVPLIYGYYAGEWVVIASKGGAPDHPAWFLNLESGPQIEFQVATQAFRGAWRVAAGDEREKVWRYMAGVYPPYDDYQKTTGGRVIPVVMLRAETPMPVFKT